MKAVMVTLHERETGAIVYSTRLNLPEGLDPNDATEADWLDAKSKVEEATGYPTVFGAPKGDQLVRNGAFVDRVKPIDERRDRAWAAIKRQRAALEVAGFPFMGKTIQNDAESALKIANRAARARDAIAAGEPFETEWTTQDNSPLVLDADQMLAMFAAMDDYADHLHDVAQGLRKELAKAKTAAEVAATVWPSVPSASTA